MMKGYSGGLEKSKVSPQLNYSHPLIFKQKRAPEPDIYMGLFSRFGVQEALNRPRLNAVSFPGLVTLNPQPRQSI